MKENQGYIVVSNTPGIKFENCSFSATARITIENGSLVDDRELQHLRMLGFDVVRIADSQQKSDTP